MDQRSFELLELGKQWKGNKDETHSPKANRSPLPVVKTILTDKQTVKELKKNNNN